MHWQYMNPRNGKLYRGHEAMPDIIKLHRNVLKSREWPRQALKGDTGRVKFWAVLKVLRNQFIKHAEILYTTPLSLKTEISSQFKPSQSAACFGPAHSLLGQLNGSTIHSVPEMRPLPPVTLAPKTAAGVHSSRGAFGSRSLRLCFLNFPLDRFQVSNIFFSQ